MNIVTYGLGNFNLISTYGLGQEPIPFKPIGTSSPFHARRYATRELKLLLKCPVLFSIKENYGIYAPLLKEEQANFNINSRVLFTNQEFYNLRVPVSLERQMLINFNSKPGNKKLKRLLKAL